MSHSFRVIAFDYEGHVMSAPTSDALTPDNVAADVPTVADAAGADARRLTQEFAKMVGASKARSSTGGSKQPRRAALPRCGTSPPA